MKTKKTSKKKVEFLSTPLSQEQIKSNVFYLEWMKNSWFNNDHPGIDRMVKDFKKEIKNRKLKNKMKKTNKAKKCECFVVVVPKEEFELRYNKYGARTKKIVDFMFEKEQFKNMTFKGKQVVVFGEVKIAGLCPDVGNGSLAEYVVENYKGDNPSDGSDDEDGLSVGELCDNFTGCFDDELDSEVVIFRQFADEISGSDTNVGASLRIVVIPKAEYDKIYKKSSPATKRIVDFFTNANQIETIKFAGIKCIMYTEVIVQNGGGFFDCIENDYNYSEEDDGSLAYENWDSFDEEVGSHKTALKDTLYNTET